MFAAFVQGKSNQNTKFKNNIKSWTFVKINKIKFWNCDKDYYPESFTAFVIHLSVISEFFTCKNIKQNFQTYLKVNPLTDTVFINV